MDEATHVAEPAPVEPKADTKVSPAGISTEAIPPPPPHATEGIAAATGDDVVAAEAEPAEPTPAADGPGEDAQAEDRVAITAGGDAVASGAEPAVPSPDPSRDAQQQMAGVTAGDAGASEAEPQPWPVELLPASSIEAEGASRAADAVDSWLARPETEAHVAALVAPQARQAGASEPVPVALPVEPSPLPPSATLAEAVAPAPLIEAVPAPVSRLPEQPAAPYWLPPSLPSREAVGELLPYVRLALRGIAAIAFGLVAIVLVLVVLYRWVDPPVSTLMLGQRLGGTPIERRWVPLDRISPHLIRAVVLSEDGGFCRHRGVDWRALEEAMESARGGSTITMQVVKNLFLWPSRSYVRKAIEITLAYLVELIWPKGRILEIYLNIAEWGDGVFGAEAAARQNFAKSAARLTPEEAALLAVALPNPVERMPASPSPGMRRLAGKLLVRMQTSRTSLACVRAPRLLPVRRAMAPHVPGLAGRLRL